MATTTPINKAFSLLRQAEKDGNAIINIEEVCTRFDSFKQYRIHLTLFKDRLSQVPEELQVITEKSQ